MAAPLFVSFSGKIKGGYARGCGVLDCPDQISTLAHIEALCRKLELDGGYDGGTVVIENFRRLEADSPSHL